MTMSKLYTCLTLPLQSWPLLGHRFTLCLSSLGRYLDTVSHFGFVAVFLCFPLQFRSQPVFMMRLDCAEDDVYLEPDNPRPLQTPAIDMYVIMTFAVHQQFVQPVFFFFFRDSKETTSHIHFHYSEFHGSEIEPVLGCLKGFTALKLSQSSGV